MKTVDREVCEFNQERISEKKMLQLLSNHVSPEN